MVGREDRQERVGSGRGIKFRRLMLKCDVGCEDARGRGERGEGGEGGRRTLDERKGESRPGTRRSVAAFGARKMVRERSVQAVK